MSIWDGVLVWHHWWSLLHPHFSWPPNSLWRFLKTYLLINPQLSGCQSTPGICPPLFYYMRSQCSLASNILVPLMILNVSLDGVSSLNPEIHISTYLLVSLLRHAINTSGIYNEVNTFFESVSCMDQNVGVIVPNSLVALRTASKPLWVQWTLPLACTLSLSASHYLSATAGEMY